MIRKEEPVSNSRRKTPIIAITTARSDKRFKRAEHSRERAAVKIALCQDQSLPDPREFGNRGRPKKTESNIVLVAPKF